MEQSPNIQKILNVTSEKELRSKGKLNEVRKVVNNAFGFKVPGKGAGWKGYYNRIVELQKLSKLFYKESPTNGDIYFKSDSAKYIYALTELDGPQRMRELNIDKDLYYSKEKAKEWRDHIAKKIHSDLNQHPFADTAQSKLNELYESMTKSQ